MTASTSKDWMSQSSSPIELTEEDRQDFPCSQYFIIPEEDQSPILANSHHDKRTEDVLKKLLTRLTGHLLDNHRASEHYLRIKDNIPEGMRIKVKPGGVYTDESTFKEKWNKAIRESETALHSTLVNHLIEAQRESLNRYRRDCKTAKEFLMDNKIPKDEAKKMVNDTGELAKKAKDEQVKVTAARKAEKQQKKKLEQDKFRDNKRARR